MSRVDIASPILQPIWPWRPPWSPLPDGSVWFGEVSLAGEIRPVAHSALRLREGAKLGFSSAYGPLKEEKASPGIQSAGIRQLAQLVDRVMR